MAVTFKLPDTVLVKATFEPTLPTADVAQAGRIVRIAGGTGQTDLFYICKKDADDLYAWELFSGLSGAITSAGTGLTKSGSSIALTDTGVSSGTYTKVTVDTQGRVTAAADLAAADLPVDGNGKVPISISGDAQTVAGRSPGTASGVATLGVDSRVPLSQIPTLGYIPTSEKAAASGVASLGSDGKVPAAQLPSLDYVPNAEKGSASGVATLGSDGKVPPGQLPSLNYIPTSEKGVANGVATLGPDGKIAIAQTPPGVLIKVDEFTATAGQSVFTLTKGTYPPGTTSLQVFIDGVKQAPSALVESSPSTFTLSEALDGGEQVVAIWFEIAPNITTVHGSTHAPGGGDDISGTYTLKAREGTANGVATLGAGGAIPTGQLPDLSGTYATNTALTTAQLDVTDDSMIIESVVAVTNEEATSVQTAMGPCTEFADAATQSVAFVRRFPYPNTNGLAGRLTVAADVANAGSFRVQTSYQINGGAAVLVPVTLTPGNTTNMSTLDFGTIFVAGVANKGDMITIKLSRLGADALDTHTGKMRIYQLRLRRV